MVLILITLIGGSEGTVTLSKTDERRHPEEVTKWLWMLYDKAH